MSLRKKLIFPFIAIVLASCTPKYLKDDVVKSLDKEYEGTYVLLKTVESGNDKLPGGKKVRLYFLSGHKSVKVYAYDPDDDREGALGNIIIYLFDTDFPEKKFMKEILDKRVKEYVKRTGN